MVSDERIKDFKMILEKERGLEVTWEEASEGAHQLDALASLMFDMWLEDERRKKKLLESPKGYCLEGVGYTCFICGNGTPAGGNWYDKHGIKCLACQKAIDKKIIPAIAAKNRESWYSKYDLESSFNIKYHALNRFIKMGVLKPRIVPDESGKPHFYLFLIKDHKDILPPKKLTESKMVKEVKDGKEYFRSLPWYRFADPHEHLKDYKIMEYLQVTHEMTELGKTIKKDLPNFPDEVIQGWLEPFAKQYNWPLPAAINSVVFGDLSGSIASLTWSKTSQTVDLLNLPLSKLEKDKMEKLYETLLNFESSDGSNLEECNLNHFNPLKFKKAFEYCKEHATTPGVIVLYKRKGIDNSTSYNVMDGNHRFTAYKYWVEKSGNAPTKKQEVWIAK